MRSGRKAGCPASLACRKKAVSAGRGTVRLWEHGRFVRTWNHRIRFRASGQGQTLYSDEVAIDAGWLTLPVWLFALLFYRYRQWRWRDLAEHL
jgi:hypothetical protein